MIDRKNLINSKQMMVIIFSAQIGIGIISLPYFAAKEMGHDAWIAVLIAGIITLAASAIITYLLKRYKDKSFYDITILLYGKFVGTSINIIFIIYLIFQAAVSLRYFEEAIKDLVLRQTPALVITAIIVIPTVYLSWYGLKPIARYANVFFIVMLSVCFLYYLNSKNFRLTFLMPVGTAPVPQIAKGILGSIFGYYGFETIAVFYPNIADRNKTMVFVLAATLITTAFSVLTIVVTTGIFGEDMLKHLVFPIYSLGRIYHAPVFERIDLFFLIVWFPAMGISMRAYFFAGYYSIIKLFKIKKTTLLLIFYTFAAGALSRVPRDAAGTFTYTNIINIFGIIMAFILPCLCLIFSFINTKGTRKGGY